MSGNVFFTFFLYNLLDRIIVFFYVDYTLNLNFKALQFYLNNIKKARFNLNCIECVSSLKVKPYY